MFSLDNSMSSIEATFGSSIATGFQGPSQEQISHEALVQEWSRKAPASSEAV